MNRNGFCLCIVHLIVELYVHSMSIRMSDEKQVEVVIIDLVKLDSSCFNGSYKELVELIGHESTLLLHKTYGGQYVTFPKKLLADAYIHELILTEYDGTNAIELAKKYNYTYSWIRKLLKKNQI